MLNVIDTKVLKEYYIKSAEWEQDFIKNFELVLGLTENEARVLVHLWRNKGSYQSRIVKTLRMNRTTLFFILERMQQRNIVFQTRSPVSGTKIYKLNNSSEAKALLSASFMLCICQNIKKGADVGKIFN